LNKQSTLPIFSTDHMMRVMRVYDDAGNVIEMHEQTGDFKRRELSVLGISARNNELPRGEA
jgi:hypothetical protein